MENGFKIANLIIPYSELEVNYVRSSGPGGQNVNKVNSKCVMHWNIAQSGVLTPDQKSRFSQRFKTKISQEGFLVTSSDRFRDQKRNFEDCIHKIKEMLGQILSPPKPRKKTKPTRSSKKKRIESKRIHSTKKEMRRKFN